MESCSEIVVSKVDRCRKCYRPLCKRKEIDGEMRIIVSHRRMLVIAANAIIGCCYCKTRYHVEAETGIEKEVHFG